MVSTRSMMMRTQVRRSAIAVALPHEVIVDIVGRVDVSSPQRMADLCSLRAMCKAMYKASKEHAVGRCMVLEREEAMKWLDNEHYLAVVNHLANAGNPEVYFIIDLMLIFAHQDMQRGLVFLDWAAIVGHKATSYVLGILYTVGEAPNIRKHYISQVEGEQADNGGEPAGAGDECETTKRINRECRRCRRLAADAVSNVTWKMAGPQGQVLAVPEDDHYCTSTDRCLNVGWDDYVVFFSDDCRIRHDYAKFFAQM